MLTWRTSYDLAYFLHSRQYFAILLTGGALGVLSRFLCTFFKTDDLLFRHAVSHPDYWPSNRGKGGRGIVERGISVNNLVASVRGLK